MPNIVICDDEPQITRAVGLKLRKAGHEVTAAADGRQAFAAAKAQPPDLIITDCQMPVMSGPELCLAVHADPELRGTPIVMLTAKALELDEAAVREHLGVIRVMFKPFSPSEIVALVDEVLGVTAREDAATPLGLPTKPHCVDNRRGSLVKA